MSFAFRLKPFFLALLAWPLLAASADDPRFAIKAYEVAGNTLLSDSDVQAVVKPFIGPESTFETIQDALRALETRYAEVGYGSVRVMLPEQEVDDGRIKLKVIEATLGKVRVEGNLHYTEDNIRASVPQLVEGRIPQMDDISLSLRLLAENPSKQTELVFRPGTRDDQIDALLRVRDDDPLKFSLSLDNTGNKATGNQRVGVLAVHNNLFDADHAATAQVMTSPGHEADVKIVGLSYRIPLYAWGDAIDLTYGYSNVNTGTLTTVGGAYGISGSGQTGSIRYSVYLPKWEGIDHKLAFGLDYRAFHNAVVPVGGGTSLVPDATVHPLSLNYNALYRTDDLELSGNLSYARNLPGGEHGVTSDFNRPGGRLGATANYDLWRYGFNLIYRLPEAWMLRLTMAGQHTDHRMVSGEMFGIGGNDTVRGFQERDVANDKGNRASFELYTPDFGNQLGGDNLRTQALVFYDMGSVRRVKALPGEKEGENIASFGFGLRVSYARNLTARLDYGIVTQATGAQRIGDGRLHGSLIWNF